MILCRLSRLVLLTLFLGAPVYQDQYSGVSLAGHVVINTEGSHSAQAGQGLLSVTSCVLMQRGATVPPP